MAGRSSTDVVIVGGGVIGLAIAWKVAAGGRQVTLVDPEPGHGATWAAAGMLAPVGESNFGEHRLTALLVEAARAWPRFAGELEAEACASIGYRQDGTLLVAVDPSDRLSLADLLGYRRSLGLEAATLSAAACRAAEPLLAPAIGGGADLIGDHQVDNRRLVSALIASATGAGVVILRRRTSALIRRAAQVSGVALDDGDELLAGAVVVAAGCWSGQLAGWPDAFRPAVRPVKGLTLRLRAGPRSSTLRRSVRGLVHGRTCYLVPRVDGTLIVGSTTEERGFDLTVEAGAVSDLLDDARRLVPSVKDYELTETTTGLRPGSPDNAPMVGHGGLSGLVLATGHYRNGILLAPITATEVVRLIDDADGLSGASEGERSPFDAFRPDRFREAARPTASTPGPIGEPAAAGHRGGRPAT